MAGGMKLVLPEDVQSGSTPTPPQEDRLLPPRPKG